MQKLYHTRIGGTNSNLVRYHLKSREKYGRINGFTSVLVILTQVLLKTQFINSIEKQVHSDMKNSIYCLNSNNIYPNIENNKLFFFQPLIVIMIH